MKKTRLILLTAVCSGTGLCVFKVSGVQASNEWMTTDSTVVIGVVLRHDSSGVNAHLKFSSESDPQTFYETDTDPQTGEYMLPAVWTDAGDYPGPLPTGFSLFPNYPNPFESQTQFVFETPYETTVKLRVYNLIGQTVDEMVAKQDFRIGAGVHGIEYTPPDLPSGVYLYTLGAFGKTLAGRMVNLGGGYTSSARVWYLPRSRALMP